LKPICLPSQNIVSQSNKISYSSHILAKDTFGFLKKAKDTFECQNQND